MHIKLLLDVVKNNLPILIDARIGNKTNHALVKKFQDKIAEDLNNKDDTGYYWETEQKAEGRAERDSVDILGKASNEPDWIIEIDATRADQVSKKLISRIALWGLKSPIQYVAILYPDTQKGRKSCEKFLRYGSDILKHINADSHVTGIFVDPVNGSVNVLRFG